ncbi:hypothetical protein ACHAW6_016007 [Cyclotella cf. meneghiniana]
MHQNHKFTSHVLIVPHQFLQKSIEQVQKPVVHHRDFINHQNNRPHNQKRFLGIEFYLRGRITHAWNRYPKSSVKCCSQPQQYGCNTGHSCCQSNFTVFPCIS